MPFYKYYIATLHESLFFFSSRRRPTILQGDWSSDVCSSDLLLIENPAAVTKNSANPKQAKAFLDFLYSPRAAQIWAENGYRPVSDPTLTKKQFKTPTGQFTIDRKSVV